MPSQRTIERFGEKLHTLRVQHDMTLQGLANQLGLTSHSYISELEAGKKIPTAELVLNVARLFGVTTDELLKDELEMTTSELD
ncbi:MAG TPA: helix-turn-helix transcriptional regulator [Pyrinomonadaceae bacterium]|nr:helix-turn-helix transcriptional regulator [Pyrinomonadaceae bacterium]